MLSVIEKNMLLSNVKLRLWTIVSYSTNCFSFLSRTKMIGLLKCSVSLFISLFDFLKERYIYV